MRGALAIAAALALSACSVDVEGAPCGRPGSGDECPSGQACGNDGTCSEAAAACVPLRWDGGSCTCPPAAAADFVADALRGSPLAATPAPTGAAEPAACRFRRLSDALAAARAAGAGATVTARAEAGETAVFGDAATGEPFPLEVPAGVALRSERGAEASVVIRADAATATDLVALQGTIEGFRIEAGAATARAVAASCGEGGEAPRIADVAIEGGALAAGVDVAAAACGAVLSGLDVANAAGPALRVAGDPAGAAVEVRASAFTASERGIVVAGGKLALGHPDEPDGVVVSGNAGEGIVLAGSAPGVDATLVEVVVSGNGGTGVVLDRASAASSLSVSRCDVFANGAASSRGYGPGSPQRTAGGVLVAQDAFGAFSFRGNRVFGNAGDELAFETNATWSLAPPDTCGAASNTFACVGDGTFAVAVGGVGSVDATGSVWPDSTANWQPYASARVSSAYYCTAVDPGTPPPPETCPDP